MSSRCSFLRTSTYLVRIESSHAYPVDRRMKTPLVGRAGELQRLTDVLDGHEANTAVLIGPAGVGKTRLADELAGIASEQGWTVIRTRGSKVGATVPFGAFAHLLPQPFDPASSRLELLYDLANRLTESGESNRTLLIVDDAHHLDDASAALTQLLTTSSPLAVLLVLREGDEGSHAAVTHWSGGDIEHVTVPPLSRTGTGQLAEVLLDGAVSRATLSELWRLTRGNPLFVVETVRAAARSGDLSRLDGMWHHSGPLGRAERLANLIEGRLAHLAPDDREVLELVAVGEPVPFPVMERAADPVRLATLEREGLVEVAGEGHRATVHTHHPLYGELLRGRMPRTRVRTAARHLADVLERLAGHSRDHILRLAIWRLEAGDQTEPQTLTDAAQEALGVYEPGLAERLARVAVEEGGGDPACLVLAQALSAVGRPEEAEAEFARIGDRDSVAVVTPRAWNFTVGLGDPRRALVALESATTSAHDRDAASQILITEATIRSFLGDLDGAIAASGRVLAQDDISPATMVEALTIHTAVQALGGKPVTAMADITRGLDMAATLDEPVPHATTKLNNCRILALEAIGSLHDAESEGRRIYHEAVEENAWHEIGVYGVAYGLVLLSRGRLHDCVRVTSEALSATERTDPLASNPACWTLRALAFAQSGDDPGARSALEELDRLHPEGHRFTVHAARAGAWLRAAEGWLSGAASVAHEAAADPTLAAFSSWTPWLLHDVVRFGFPEMVVDDLSELAGQVEGAMVGTLAQHARAALSGRGADLEEAARMLESLGADLIAAEAYTSAAAAYRRDGDSRAGVRTERSGLRLALSCQGARTPGLAAAPEPLTSRQREIARLAAGGMSSKEIADRLYISPRTVDNHLGQVYARLGITGRDELPRT